LPSDGPELVDRYPNKIGTNLTLEHYFHFGEVSQWSYKLSDKLTKWRWATTHLYKTLPFIRENNLTFRADTENITTDWIGTYEYKIFVYNELEQNNTYYVTVHLLPSKESYEFTPIDRSIIK
jgi:hypothetical protein